MLPGFRSLDNSGGVGSGQRVRHWDGVGQGFGRVEAAASDQLVQGPAFDVLHHHEVDAVFASDVMDDDNVGVIEGGGSLGFLHEAALALRIGRPLAQQDFHRHESIQMKVAGLVDDAHPAFAQLGFDSIVAKNLVDHYFAWGTCRQHYSTADEAERLGQRHLYRLRRRVLARIGPQITS